MRGKREEGLDRAFSACMIACGWLVAFDRPNNPGQRRVDEVMKKRNSEGVGDGLPYLGTEIPIPMERYSIPYVPRYG